MTSIHSRFLVAVLVAAVIGGCASWKRFGYEGWGRDRWQAPDKVVTTLALRPGMHVADIGAGGGYFTFRLAEAVGPTGKVFAVDVDPDMTQYIAQRAAAESVANVEVVLAPYDAPGLAADSVDLLFTCNTYHHIENPAAYFERAKATLRPGGRLAIIDFNGTGWFSRLFAHSTPVEQLQGDMAQAGFELVAQLNFLSQQNFLIFRRAGDH